MSNSRDKRKLSSNTRWNASRFQSLSPAVFQDRLNRIYVGLFVISGLGLWLSDQRGLVSGFWRLASVAPFILLIIWTWAIVLMWVLGLRSGWMVENGRLVVQGPIRKRSFGRGEIRSVYEISGRRSQSWTAILTDDSEHPFIAVGIPVAEVPGIRRLLGIENTESWSSGRNEKDAELVLWPRADGESLLGSLLGSVGRLFGRESDTPTEGEVLVGRARAKTRLNLTPAQVGLVRGIKLASLLSDANEFGVLCSDEIVSGLGDQIEGIDGLANAERILEQFVVYLGLLREQTEFEIEQLAIAMGESSIADRSSVGGLTMEFLGSMAPQGGVEDVRVRHRVEELAATDSRLHGSILAWVCLAIARLAAAGEVPRLEELPAWNVV